MRHTRALAAALTSTSLDKENRADEKRKRGESLWCRPRPCSGARPDCEVIQSDRKKCKSFRQLALTLAHNSVFDAVVICRSWRQFPRLSDLASKSSTTNTHVIFSNLASTFMGSADLGNLRLCETVSASEPQPRDSTGYKFNLWLRAGVRNTRLLDPLQLKVFFFFMPGIKLLVIRSGVSFTTHTA